jgi:hypothetical protein
VPYVTSSSLTVGLRSLGRRLVGKSSFAGVDGAGHELHSEPLAAERAPNWAYADPAGEVEKAPSSEPVTNDPIRARPLRDVDGELVHPVYLDVPMMASFYAALDLAIEQEQTSEGGTAGQREGSVGASAKVGLPGLPDFVSPLKLTAQAEIAESHYHEESLARRSIFQHTEASLFNRLRDSLAKRERILCLATPNAGEGDAQGTRRLEVGCLVEVPGQIVRNPLDQILATYARIEPFAGAEESRRRRKQVKPPLFRRMWEAIASAPTTETVGERIMNSDPAQAEFVTAMREDLELAGVRDLVMTPDASTGLSVIIVASSEFFSEKTAEYLLDGRFTVLGKVTSVFLDSRETIDLTRRTALGVSGQARAKKVVDQVVKKYNLAGRRSPGRSRLAEAGRPVGPMTAEGAVQAPAIQVLPLAIFV